MKNLTKAALAGLCLMMACGSSHAFNVYEKTAQTQMNSYLNSLNYDTQIKQDDQSINFMVGENIFWLTVEGDKDGMLYTLHRRPIKLDEIGKDKNALDSMKEDAIRSAVSISAKNPYKAYVDGYKVKFEFPVYASSVAEYKKVFPLVLKSLNKVSMKQFDEEMKNAKKSNNSNGNSKVSDSLDCIVLEQPEKSKSSTAKSGDVYVNGIDISSVDKSGQVLIDYDDIKYRDKMQFMKPRIKVSANKEGRYSIGVKIYNPDGKLLVPAKGEKLTMVCDVDLRKKPQIVELDSFGTSDSSFWQGNKNYKVVIVYDGKDIDSREFTIL